MWKRYLKRNLLNHIEATDNSRKHNTHLKVLEISSKILSGSLALAFGNVEPYVAQQFLWPSV